ncbi:MAG: trimeric intracellular cation channel family protein [Moraxella sp.]|nr:trimeric intracellular cation channel family protein [Moraxella sp.]
MFDVIYVLDMIGVIACATAGTILAMKKNFDFFGCILVSMVGAIGGGTVRDVILDRHPLFWTQDLSYLIVITITSLLVQLFINHSHKLDLPLKLFDAVGLSAFSVIGFGVAVKMGYAAPICVLMAVLTSIAGGIMRDMICNEIPLVLQKEIYISASVVGSLSFIVLTHFGVAKTLADFVMLVVIFIVRMLAIRFDWHLPTLGGRF